MSTQVPVNVENKTVLLNYLIQLEKRVKELEKKAAQP